MRANDFPLMVVSGYFDGRRGLRQVDLSSLTYWLLLWRSYLAFLMMLRSLELFLIIQNARKIVLPIFALLMIC
jgi:hypothetical protein